MRYCERGLRFGKSRSGALSAPHGRAGGAGVWRHEFGHDGCSAPGMMMTATIKFPMSCQNRIGEDCMTLERAASRQCGRSGGRNPGGSGFLRHLIKRAVILRTDHEGSRMGEPIATLTGIVSGELAVRSIDSCCTHPAGHGSPTGRFHPGICVRGSWTRRLSFSVSGAA